MLVLLNVTMELSNLRKNKEIIICDRRIVKFDIGTTLCDNGTIKFEKNIKEPLYMTKELSNLILELHNMIMEPSNLRNK